jgi:hypothetical protein
MREAIGGLARVGHNTWLVFKGPGEARVEAVMFSIGLTDAGGADGVTKPRGRESKQVQDL